VSDLQSMLSANTELILIWRAPLEPNGKIEKYEVFLKVINADKKIGYQFKLIKITQLCISN